MNITVPAAAVSPLNQTCQLAPLVSDPGNWTLAIFLGPAGVRGSPFRLAVEVASVDPARSYVVGSGSIQVATCLSTLLGSSTLQAAPDKRRDHEAWQ